MSDSIFGDIASAFSGVTDWLGSNVLSSSTFNTLVNTASAGFDIYQGINQMNQANKMYDILYGTASKQDTWADAMADRTETVYWPFEDLQYEYATADLETKRPADEDRVDYYVTRTAEQLAQAAIINPQLDTTEQAMITLLSKSADDLEDTYRAQASADVASAYAGMRAQNSRQFAQAGVNPSAGIMASFNLKMDTTEAAAQSAARTMATRAAEDKALARQAAALNYRAGVALPSYTAVPSFNADSISRGLSGVGAMSMGGAQLAGQNAQDSFAGAATSLNNIYWQPYKTSLRNELINNPLGR